jgi:hypothetical protein
MQTKQKTPYNGSAIENVSVLIMLISKQVLRPEKLTDRCRCK